MVCANEPLKSRSFLKETPQLRTVTLHDPRLSRRRDPPLVIFAQLNIACGKVRLRTRVLAAVILLLLLLYKRDRHTSSSRAIVRIKIV